MGLQTSSRLTCLYLKNNCPFYQAGPGRDPSDHISWISWKSSESAAVPVRLIEPFTERTKALVLQAPLHFLEGALRLRPETQPHPEEHPKPRALKSEPFMAPSMPPPICG